MSLPVPVAVIGCGHLGTFHARLYRELPEACLVSVMDVVPEKARALGESLGVPWTTDLDAALAASAAVSVATPTVTHGAVVEACLRAGRNVLVEKPLAATLAEGESIVRLAAASGLVLLVGHVERFNPAFRAARSRIGAPRFIESHRLSTFVPRALDVDVVLDLMIHDLDLVLGMISGPIESVDAVGVPVLTAGEDIANARIRFADGAVANLTASRVSRERVRKIRFFGRRQYLSIDLLEKKVEQVALEDAGIPKPAGSAGEREGSAEERALLAHLAERGLELRHGPIPVADCNPLQEELRDFLAAVEGGAPAGATGADGLRALETALEVRRHVQDSLLRLGLGGAPDRA